MDNFLKILKRYWIWFMVSVVGIVLVVVVNVIFSGKEVKSWSFGEQWDRSCPYLGGYPILYKNELPLKYHGYVERAVGEINNEIGFQLDMGLIYVPYRQVPSKSHVLVRLVAAPKSFYKFGKVCEYFKLGDKGGVTTAAGLAEFRTVWRRNVLLDATIYLCIDKIEKGMRLMNTPAVDSIRAIGWKGIIKHELVHGLIGEKHPKWGGILMHRAPDSADVGIHVLEIIKKHVIPVCRKHGKL